MCFFLFSPPVDPAVMTGFGHNTVMSVADKVVGAVKEGKLSHIFLVGGCDAAEPERQYYTQLVKDTPKDTIILTLGCAKVIALTCRSAPFPPGLMLTPVCLCPTVPFLRPAPRQPGRHRPAPPPGHGPGEGIRTAKEEELCRTVQMTGACAYEGSCRPPLQCNDAYSAIHVASELAKVFNTDVNGLPLSLDISWVSLPVCLRPP